MGVKCRGGNLFFKERLGAKVKTLGREPEDQGLDDK